jgi:hypothetical protein
MKKPMMMGQNWRKMPYYACLAQFLIQAIDKIALDIYLPPLLGLDCGNLIHRKIMQFFVCFTFAMFNCAKQNTNGSTKRKWKFSDRRCWCCIG